MLPIYVKSRIKNDLEYNNSIGILTWIIYQLIKSQSPTHFSFQNASIYTALIAPVH